MKIYTHPEEVPASCMALGNFDGVHCAHRKVLRECVRMAERMRLQSGVLLFRTMLKPMIMPLSDKLAKIEECGIDFVYLVDFTEAFKNLSKEAFLRFLFEDLRVRGISVGYDYRFSKNAEGSVADLEQYRESICLSVLPPFCRDGIPVSSTKLREALAEGDTEQFFHLSGRYFSVSGIVQKGKQNGRKMGFRTANLKITEGLFPSDGVYSGWTIYRNQRYPSVINVGKNPTFSAAERTVESHLLDFDGDLYGEKIEVRFLRKLRGEIRFSDMEALKKQISEDRACARKELIEMENRFTGIILAAEKDTRMKSEKPKALHRVAGKTLLRTAIDTCKNAGAERVISIIGHKADMVREEIGTISEYFDQAEEKSIQDTLAEAADLLSETDETVVILPENVPLLRAETLLAALAKHREEQCGATVLTATVLSSEACTGISRNKNGEVDGITGNTVAEEATMREIFSGICIFEKQTLVNTLKDLSAEGGAKKYVLADILAFLLEKGRKLGAYIAEDADEFRSINDRIQLAEAERILQDRLRRYHMQNGVTMLAPETVFLEAEVEIGRDTIIESNVLIKSGTKIGSNCLIGTNSTIEGSCIADGAEILSSVILDSEIGEGTHVGPFAYVRPNTVVGRGVRVGDFVELKNSKIGDDTKISHLTYVGDSDVGERVNFGCGTVTVNYDGKKKYRTNIGDDCFIGCNTNLVAPVSVERGGYTAAGSTITDTVPEESLAIARARQVVKTNWKDRRK